MAVEVVLLTVFIGFVCLWLVVRHTPEERSMNLPTSESPSVKTETFDDGEKRRAEEFEAHKAKLQEQVADTVDDLRKAFDDRFEEMLREHEADKAGYSVTVQRFGDLLSFHVKRGEAKRTFAINATANMPIVLDEGEAPKRAENVQWWFEHEKSLSPSTSRVTAHRLGSLKSHVIGVRSRWHDSEPIFCEDARQSEATSGPPIRWRFVPWCRLPDDEFLAGPEIKTVDWGADDTIRFNGLPEKLHIPHGLGQQVYDEIMRAAAADTLRHAS